MLIITISTVHSIQVQIFIQKLWLSNIMRHDDVTDFLFFSKCCLGKNFEGFYKFLSLINILKGYLFFLVPYNRNQMLD